MQLYFANWFNQAIEGDITKIVWIYLFIYLFDFVQQKSVQEVYNKAETEPDFSIDFIFVVLSPRLPAHLVADNRSSCKYIFFSHKSTFCRHVWRAC